MSGTKQIDSPASERDIPVKGVGDQIHSRVCIPASCPRAGASDKRHNEPSSQYKTWYNSILTDWGYPAFTDEFHWWLQSHALGVSSRKIPPLPLVVLTRTTRECVVGATTNPAVLLR